MMTPKTTTTTTTPKTTTKELWRSLREKEQGVAVPAETEHDTSAFERREFLRLMGASMALAGAGVGGCTTQPDEKIVPYVRAPEEIVAGSPLYFATSLTPGGCAQGVLVESHMGRPTKIEGNPEHPASLGATDAQTQAAVLDLYDPDRSQTVTRRSEITHWSAFLSAAQVALGVARIRRGQGLRILTETVTSPTLGRQLLELRAALPEARWVQWEPMGRDAARAGARLAFGDWVSTHYRVDRADVILSLDADLFGAGPGHVRYVRQFSDRRDPAAGTMPRLYVAESTPSITGSKADHRFSLAPRHVEAFARAIARKLGVAVEEGGALPAAAAAAVDAIARDLSSHRGAGIVAAGDHAPPVVHALAHAINHALDNVPSTVVHTDPVEVDPSDQLEQLSELVREMKAGQVETLVVLGANPVFTAPADLRFEEAFRRVRLRIHHGLHQDETAALSHWHVAATHPLEHWSDARAFDGSISTIQPLIAPLYGGKSVHEMIQAFTEHPELSGYEIVRATHAQGMPAADFEALWRRAVHDGVWPGSAPQPRAVVPRADLAFPAPSTAEGLEILFRPDPNLHDGRFANNGWLQELARPFSKLMWDGAALVAPATAARLRLEDGDVVELSHDGRKVRAPVWRLPGQPRDVITLHVGGGRTRAGRVGDGVGFDAYRLRTSSAPWSADGVKLRKTGERAELACTQEHQVMHGRDLVRVQTLGEDASHEHHHPEPPPSLSMYPRHRYDGYAWGMAIDLSRCTGCNACVVACQAENNIAVVGKDEVLRGREMQWIRVDTYLRGDEESPERFHQPIPCMHCENAPCEVVCPVEATVHSSEGLNDMVYNRCVGTKYCANNCPYKVRRFNFYQYTDDVSPSLALQRNPDVTVRSYGVMEKCSYCVQRINLARIDAEREDRRLRDGAIVTACQQACPAGAIVFGDINDRQSRIARLRKSPRHYSLLAELGTRPRTTYLSVVKNPNPDIEGA